MNWKKTVKFLLFPHPAILTLLVPISVAFLVYSMVTLETDSVMAIAAYVLAAYTLTAVCVRIPSIIIWARRFKNENPLAIKWCSDTRLRVNTSLYGALLWNTVYGVFQLWLGIYHRTFWFASFGFYYICLAVMRFFLLRYTRRYAPGERMKSELIRYRACGWVFLFMNLSLALIVFFMIYWNRSFEHHMITAIAMAAYTFFAFVSAIVSVIKYRRYNSPVFSACKAISFAAACVSMLTLTSTMLTTFSEGTMSELAHKLLLVLTGAAVFCVIVAMALYMIVQASRKMKILKTEKMNG